VGELKLVSDFLADNAAVCLCLLKDYNKRNMKCSPSCTALWYMHSSFTFS
jgi:hypothetical protein